MTSPSPEDIISSSQDNSETIQPLNRSTIHRMCSNQVVTTLPIAVKELVENSLDAGATIIDIQLKEYGSEIIEVADNGTGVKEENFQALTLKHYTSKIKQFDDLSNLSTLGFRGEALSSLCALSELTILTKHKSCENATKIKYDSNGRIVSRVLGAREQGTTVTLQNIFSSIVVRRKDFLKNLKSYFNKTCQLLYAYCLVSKGVKFTCSNTTTKGKNIVVSTDGLNSVRDNIINVFGAKQISSLIDIEIVKPESPILEEYGIQLVEGEILPFSFEFFISSVLHGSGRSTTDRQFFYINSRPCEPTKIMKLVNEVYKQYNSNQYPFVYLNIMTHSCLVDVNLRPDKRQVFLEKEKILLATVKASLIEAFKNFPSTFKFENLDVSQNVTMKDFLESKKREKKGLKRTITDSRLKKGSILEKFKKRSKTESDKVTSPISSFCEKKSNVMLDTFLKVAEELDESLEEEDCEKFERNKKEEEDVTIVCNKIKEKIITITPNKDKMLEETSCKNKESKEIQINSSKDKNVKYPIILEEETCKNEKTGESPRKIQSSPSKDKIILKEDCKNEDKEPPKQIKIILDQPKDKSLQDSLLDEDVEISIDTSKREHSNYKTVTLDVTLDTIKQSLKNKQKNEENRDVRVKFRSKIDPQSNKSAEEELNKQISKTDFQKMEIVGQFNLGFIIAKLESDLFIIDQHATDEKYNFEQLQANTVMENQVLVNPRPLQLTAGNESLLIENEEIFKKNGFTFKIDESAPCTKKVTLTSVPLSKNVIFGRDDIDEMLFMLQDCNHTMCRPSRIRAMFASRACRKSVMIGKALSKGDMRKLVDHMGEIEQPWNCPHGRPTMRHLINLDLIHQDQDN